MAIDLAKDAQSKQEARERLDMYTANRPYRDEPKAR